ncbi:Myotubularin protein 13 [Fasciola gigantica]|uniref:Myotubularin protein 13 n=1 Tax=Fasciola gigantica TaxID=46835 RepID=A0A504Y8D0_FASGI|nr:Myotubularin protein 13 [Fasciola gigantica]
MNVGSALEYISALEAWIRRFVEKVTDENSLISHRTSKIHEKIEGVIEGHLLNLETIYPEVKNIPKTKKPEIANPTLLASEVAIPIGGYDCVRCQLLVDGRLERTDCQLLDALGDLSAAGSGAQNGPDKSGPTGSPVENEFEVDAMLRPLLPAQGALFVTNYRIIFTGVPKDPYQSNKVITRSFPIAALHSIKKLGVMRITTVFPATTSAQPNPYAPSQRRAGTLFTVKRSRAAGPMSKRKGGYRGTSASGGGVEVGGRKGLVRFDENLDVIALRALTLQLLKLGFDPDEITPDTRDELRSLLNELRYPSTLRMGFNSPPFGLSLTPTITHLKPELDSRLSMTRTDSVGPYKLAKYERRNSVSSIRSTVIGELLPARQASLGASYQTTGSSGIRVSPEPLATGSRYANDAATAIAVVLSSSVVSRIDTRLVKLIINSPGYLDMARFGLGSAPSSTSSTMNTGPGSSGYQSGCTGAVGSSSNRLSVLMHSNLAYSNGARLVAYNARYELTKSYPTLLVIPASINHSCLNKLARSYRQGRFPVVTWQHPQNGAYLFRGSGFHSKSILGALKHVGSSGPTANPVVDKDGSEESGEQATSHTSSSKEHARYLLALVDMSFGAMSAAGFSNIGQPSSTGSDSMYEDREHISASMNTSTTIVSPLMEPGQHHRRSNHTLAVSNAFQFSGSKTRSLGRIAGIAMGQYRGRGTPMGSMASGLEVDTSSTASSSQVHIRGGGSPRTQSSRTQARVSGVTGTVNPMAAALYLLGERSMMKNLAKHSNLRSVEFVPVDFFSYSAIADSFKILFKACLPHDLGKSCGTGGSIGSQNSPPDLDPIGAGSAVSSGGGGGGSGGTSSAGGGGGGGGTNSVNVTGQTSASLQTANIHTAINDSGWLIQIQSLLQLAGAVVYLLDTQGASVALCLEDGTDAVTQTVALAQIMLDPHYRTLAGFWALVEKEWLLFGHRFNQRLNQTVNSKADPVSPVFLQFLDAVHQLLRQFPLSFEFNDFFLQFLAHHHISNRFHNFKYDNEAERVNAWLNVNEGLNRNFSAPACVTNNAVSASSATTSVAGSEQDKLLQQYDQHSIWTYIQRQHDEWPVFFNFRYSQQMGEKTLRPATNLASLDIWQFYLSEDLATGPTYDLDHFSPSYRKQNNRPYEPILRQGFNNTHVEQTYAVLGLREGEEAIGWRRAWEQAQEEVNFYPQVPPVRRRLHRLIIDSSTATRSGKPSESSSKTSGLHELISPNRLTITMDFREGSEPANSLTAMNTDTLFAPPPRRALSGAMNDLSHSCINHTTLTPQRAAGMKSSGEPVGASSDPSFRVDSNLNRTAKAKDDLPQVVNGLIPNGKAVRIVRAHPTHSLTSESEDEAFHDDGLEEAYTEPDDLGSDIDSLDDCMAARSAAMDDHRAATLRRLTRRPLRLTQNSELLSQPSLETGLSSGFGNESDSLTSGSVYSSNQPKSAVLSTVATVDEIATSTLMFSTPHKFVQATVSMSNVRCQYCQNILLSFSTGRTAARCTQCSYLCHEKCAPLVPKYCRPGGRPSPSATIPNSSDPTSSHTSLRQHSMLSGLHEEEQNSDRARLAGFLSPKPPWRTTHESTRNSEPISRNSAILVSRTVSLSRQDRRTKPGERSPQSHSQFSVERLDGNARRLSETASPSVPTIPSHLASASFYGLLYKMNHRKLLQHWKQRFFVLDTTRHQLRYYDTISDEVPRGCVDLQDVRAVRLLKSVVPHQKRVTDCGVFELDTGTRTYRFAAEPAEKAAEWVERIQNTIQ